MKKISLSKLIGFFIAFIPIVLINSTGLAGPNEKALAVAPPFAQGPEPNLQITGAAAGVIELIRGDEASLQSGCAPIGPIGSIVLQRRLVYTALEGACGLPGLEACDGRITEITESCAGPDSQFVQTPFGGPQILANFEQTSGKIRRCFDPTGASNCTGATPVGEVISEGGQSTYGISRREPTDPGRVIVQNTVSTIGYEILAIDGRSVSVGDRTYLGSVYGELVQPTTCGWRGIAEAGGPPGVTRACEFIAYTMGTTSAQ